MKPRDNYRLLIIDDESSIRRFVSVALPPHGYEILEAENAAEGLHLLQTAKPDAIILDLGLPDMDGLEALKKIRESHTLPVIILSVRDDEESIVTALDSGAHDYLRKPFLLGELLARLRLAMRSHQFQQLHPIYTSGNLTVDLSNRRVVLAGKDIKLTLTEYELLRVLIQHKGQVLSHGQILGEVWGPKSTEHIQYLRVYIGHLRQKLESDPNNPQMILTEPGVGYKLKDLGAVRELEAANSTV